MVVVDSSGWIEFFIDGPKADQFAPHLSDLENVITPVVVIYEVFKKIKRERGEALARLCVSQIEKTEVIPLTHRLALEAAELSIEYSLPMADSFILATARLHRAKLITRDSDFRGITGVQVF